MQVIFVKELKNQGKKGEIKEVKDGYAKNFLIKNGYAVAKNIANERILNKEKEKEAKLDAQNKENAKKVREQLEKEILKFQVKTGDKDKVFGSVSAKQIKEKLDEHYQISKNQINLKTPLTTLGFHNVEINLYKDIKATIRIELAK